MIRINLLPVRAGRRRATGQRHLFVIFVLLVLECLGFFYLYNEKDADLQQRLATNKQQKGQIEKLKREVGDIESLQSQKKQLEQQQEVLDALEFGRSGPVKVLGEIMFMLTPPVDAKARLELERRKGQPNWEAKRSWIRSFVEQDRQVSIIGESKSNDDVAEFLTRLGSSDYFTDVKLLWTKQSKMVLEGREIRYVKFQVRCRVSYVGKGKAELIPRIPTGGH